MKSFIKNLVKNVKERIQVSSLNKYLKLGLSFRYGFGILCASICVLKHLTEKNSSQSIELFANILRS